MAGDSYQFSVLSIELRWGWIPDQVGNDKTGWEYISTEVESISLNAQSYKPDPTEGMTKGQWAFILTVTVYLIPANAISCGHYLQISSSSRRR